MILIHLRSAGGGQEEALRVGRERKKVVAVAVEFVHFGPQRALRQVLLQGGPADGS